MDLSFHPPITVQSSNNFAEENNLQWCPDLSASILHKEITCAMLAHGKQTTYMRKISYAMLHRPCLDNIAQEYCLVNVVQTRLDNNAQENYLCNVGPERTNTFSQENQLYYVALICLYQHHTIKLPVQC